MISEIGAARIHLGFAAEIRIRRAAPDRGKPTYRSREAAGQGGGFGESRFSRSRYNAGRNGERHSSLCGVSAPSLIAGQANDPRVKTVTARLETAAAGRLGGGDGNRDVHGFRREFRRRSCIVRGAAAPEGAAAVRRGKYGRDGQTYVWLSRLFCFAGTAGRIAAAR